MLIAVDMDSVIASLRAPLINFHNDRYGTELKPFEIRSYDLSIAWNCSSEEKLERIFEFYKSSYMNDVKPVKGSREGIEILSKKHELIIVTSRPTWIKEKTDDWVETYFSGLFMEIVHTNQVSKETEEKKLKSEVCIEFGADLMIEDHIDYANDCAQNDIKVFLYNRPWNENRQLHPTITRVKSWKQIIENLA